MEVLALGEAFTLIEPGPVILVTTHDGHQDNVMTLTWSMVLDFTPTFAISTGAWNHSYAALCDQRECVLSIPGVDLIDKAIGIGTCSGRDTAKFAVFGLTRVNAQHVRAPLIGECLGNIECWVVDIIERHNILVLQGVAAYVNMARDAQAMFHAVGDGTFIADGARIDRKEMMRSRLPEGL